MPVLSGETAMREAVGPAKSREISFPTLICVPNQVFVCKFKGDSIQLRARSMCRHAAAQRHGSNFAFVYVKRLKSLQACLKNDKNGA
jgi:hypothetical protein